MVTPELLKRFEKIVGQENFSSDKEDLIAYSRDQFSPLVGDFMPDAVIRPGSVEEVQKVIQAANEYKVTVYPASYGTNLLALTLAITGGIVLDMRRMDNILEINEKTMTTIIEQGVTWGKLRREASKKGLEPMPLIGPFTGSPVANYLYDGGGTYDQEHYKVIGLEAVLPNGEIVRTGGLALNSSVKNPYISMGFGPNLTELFRVSLGIFGVVTKMVYRLHPIREAEEHVEIAFPTLPALMEGMMEGVRLGFAHYIWGMDQGWQSQVITGPVDWENKKRREEIKAELPPYTLVVGLSGKRRQVAVLKEILLEEMERFEGKEWQAPEYMRNDNDDLARGCSLTVNHMFREGPLFWPGALIPPYRAPEWFEKTVSLLREHDIRDNDGNPLVPNLVIIPWCNNECLWFEQDCVVNPLDEEAVQKMRRFMQAYLKLSLEEGSGTIFFDQTVQPFLDPGFVHLLKEIKKVVDPNMIFAPNKI